MENLNRFENLSFGPSNAENDAAALCEIDPAKPPICPQRYSGVTE
jgi:hypothetical protein